MMFLSRRQTEEVHLLQSTKAGTCNMEATHRSLGPVTYLMNCSWKKLMMTYKAYVSMKILTTTELHCNVLWYSIDELSTSVQH